MCVRIVSCAFFNCSFKIRTCSKTKAYNYYHKYTTAGITHTNQSFLYYFEIVYDPLHAQQHCTVRTFMSRSPSHCSNIWMQSVKYVAIDEVTTKNLDEWWWEEADEPTRKCRELCLEVNGGRGGGEEESQSRTVAVEWRWQSKWGNVWHTEGMEKQRWTGQ